MKIRQNLYIDRELSDALEALAAARRQQRRCGTHACRATR